MCLMTIKTILRMNNNEIYKTQKLLYVWLSKLGRRSLDSIKTNCDYLVENHNIITSNPIWEIFWPLVFSGVADHTGKGYYALTEPLILKYDSHYYYINNIPVSGNFREVSVGIYISNSLVNNNDIKEVAVEPKAILKKFPSVDKIVDDFSKSLQDERELKYYDKKNRKGVAELEKEGLKRFFSNPEKAYIRELPDRTIMPDAFAIAYCYGRVISGEGNGIYIGKQKKLIMPSFAIPFTLFRVLQLETMAYKNLPEKNNNNYIFNGVSAPVVKELNRVLCNSIRYE